MPETERSEVFERPKKFERSERMRMDRFERSETERPERIERFENVRKVREGRLGISDSGFPCLSSLSGDSICATQEAGNIAIVEGVP